MENQNEILIFIGLGSLVMLILALVIILFSLNYRRKMLEKEKKIQLMEQEKRIEIFKAAVEAEGVYIGGWGLRNAIWPKLVDGHHGQFTMMSHTKSDGRLS